MNNRHNQGSGESELPTGDSGEIVQTPHDRLLSRTLRQKASAEKLIRSHFPPALVAHLKPETLEPADTSFIDANLKRRFADHLFRVELTDETFRELGAVSRNVHLLVLVDHKSTPDKYTVIQLLGYILRIWERSIENNLPVIPIIPWIIYNGVRPWTAATSLEGLIPVPESWKRYVPGFELPILDVSRMSDAAMAGESVLQITLTLLKYGRDRELLSILRRVFGSVAHQFEGDRASTLFDTMRKYIMSVNPVVGESELQGVFAEFWPVKPEPGSVADQLLAKGRREGRHEGRQEGRQEGEIKLIRTLESILGIEQQATDLSNMTLEELQRITESLQARVKGHKLP